MNEIAIDDPCLLFAVGREAAPFRRLFRPHQRFPGAPGRARFCGEAWLPVLVLETGVGRAMARRALEWLFQPPALGNVPYRPKLVIAAGFAGALQEGYRVGDVLLATEVTDGAGNTWPVTWPADLGPGEWSPPLHRGRLLSLAELVGSPEEKARLGTEHRADAVDMESAAIARACHERGVPFGCVRVISDDVHTPLSEKLVAVLGGGRVVPWRLLLAVARSPGLVKELWRLGKQTRFAGEQLARALGELLTLTLRWAERGP